MCFPETPVALYLSAWCNVSEDLNHQNTAVITVNFKLNEAVQRTFRPTDRYTDLGVDSCERLAKSMSICLVYDCSSWLHYLTITIRHSQHQSFEAVPLYLQTQGSRIKEELLYFLSHCS
jgi:hypothetical protein